MSDWNAIDWGLLASAGYGIHQDIESTKAVMKQTGSHENNPLYGAHPSDHALDNAQLLGMGLTGLLASQLPAEYRRPLLAGITGFELGLADKNSKYTEAGKTPTVQDDMAPYVYGILGALGTSMLNPGIEDSEQMQGRIANKGMLSPMIGGDAKHPTIGLKYRKDF